MPDIPPEYLRYGAIGLAVIGAFWVFGKLTGGKKEPDHNVPVSCKGCGWKGRVSKYARKCPKCNAAL